MDASDLAATANAPASISHAVGDRLRSAHFTVGAAHKATDGGWETRSTAAILDLVMQLGQADDLRSAAGTLANKLQAHFGCQRVAVGLRRGRWGRCRLAAVSGVADHDGGSETLRRLETALDEAVLHDSLTVWPPQGDDPGQSAAAHRDLATLLGCGGAIGAPLRRADDSILGAWVFVGSEEFVREAPHHRLIETASQAVGTTFELLGRAEGGFLRRAWRHLFKTVPLHRSKVFWAVLAGLAALMFVPVPYFISAECELQPVVRRFVAAPHAGEFQKSLVKPGDLVARGQVLGRMDGREIRWELAGLIAEQERARKSRDVNMAGGKTAAAQIDQLEAERQRVKRQLLEERLAHLDIKNPIDGIVVSGDLERSQGVPVNVGQVLYEVAPLEQLMAEVAIADEDITRVSERMTATLRFDAHPGSHLSGDIARIQPRSVTRDKDNVFLGEIPLDNAAGGLRPGMKGHARIRAADQPLGWILFHKPWEYVCSWLDF